jgi:hypothetical protein
MHCLLIASTTGIEGTTFALVHLRSRRYPKLSLSARALTKPTMGAYRGTMRRVLAIFWAGPAHLTPPPQPFSALLTPVTRPYDWCHKHVPPGHTRVKPIHSATDLRAPPRSKPTPPPTTPAALLAPMLERRGRPSPHPGCGKGVRHSAIIIVRPQDQNSDFQEVVLSIIRGVIELGLSLPVIPEA